MQQFRGGERGGEGGERERDIYKSRDTVALTSPAPHLPRLLNRFLVMSSPLIGREFSPSVKSFGHPSRVLGERMEVLEKKKDLRWLLGIVVFP